MSDGLSNGSRKMGFKSLPELDYAVGNDEKSIFNITFWKYSLMTL